MAALWTGLAGVVLILKHYSDAFSLRFVLDIGPNFAVAPSADFLVALLRQVYFISDIPDIACNDGACLPFNSHIDDSSTDLMLHVPQDMGMFGFHACLRSHEALVPSGAIMRQHTAHRLRCYGEVLQNYGAAGTSWLSPGD
jgi:hypothetical protein